MMAAGTPKRMSHVFTLSYMLSPPLYTPATPMRAATPSVWQHTSTFQAYQSVLQRGEVLFPGCLHRRTVLRRKRYFPA